MKYSEVQKLLDDAIGGANVNIGFHHAFWRTQTRDQFVAFSYRGVQLIVLGNPTGSGLVWALEGTSPFGKDNPAPVPNATFNRMPDPVTPTLCKAEQRHLKARQETQPRSDCDFREPHRQHDCGDEHSNDDCEPLADGV